MGRHLRRARRRVPRAIRDHSTRSRACARDARRHRARRSRPPARVGPGPPERPAPYLGAASGRAALDALTGRHPLHRFGGGISAPPSIARERWAIRTRDALRAHLRTRGQPIPDEDGMLELLAHPGLAELRAELGLVDALPDARVAATTRPLSIANLRMFLESPVQAWAQAVLDLDELP